MHISLPVFSDLYNEIKYINILQCSVKCAINPCVLHLNTINCCPPQVTAH